MPHSHFRVPRTSRAALCAVTALVLVCAAGSASARTYILSLSGATNQVETDGGIHPIEFDGTNDSIDLAFTASATVAFYFSAECNVGALDNQTWLDLDIRVDGVAVAPSNGDNALCTSKSVQSTTGRWVTASSDAVRSFAPGTYTIDVTGRLSGFSAGDSWRMNETILVLVITEDN